MGGLSAAWPVLPQENAVSPPLIAQKRGPRVGTSDRSKTVKTAYADTVMSRRLALGESARKRGRYKLSLALVYRTQ